MARNAALEAILGAPLGELTEEHVRGFVGQVREVPQLDFKVGLYSDAKKLDLVSDVAAMANTLGGALILGIEETDGFAVGLKPVELSDGEERRMHQIVASNCAPNVPFAIHRVPIGDDPAKGYYVLDVPRSAWAPHAVVETKENRLRYPKRDGSGTRCLSESEVADAYRSRMSGAREQGERLNQVRREGEEHLAPEVKHGWLTVSLVPNVAGEWPITAASVTAAGEFVRKLPGPAFIVTPVRDERLNFRAGPRRAVANVAEDDRGNPIAGRFELHSDGAAFGAMWLGFPSQDAAGVESTENIEVNDEVLTQAVIDLLQVTTCHATMNGGTSGDALVEVTLWCSMLPMTLHHGRGFRRGTWNQLRVASVPPGRHTISLDDTITPLGLLIASRLLINDITQGLGVPACPQIRPDGTVRTKYWGGPTQQRVRAQADAMAIPVTEDDTLD